MKKKILAIVLLFVFALTIIPMDIPVAQASSPTYFDVDNPEGMPYTAKFSFRKVNVEPVISGSSDGKISVYLDNIRLNTPNKTKVTVSVYQQDKKGKWKVVKGGKKTVTITGEGKDYVVKFKIPSKKLFYVRLSKSEFTDSYAMGTMRIKD